MWSSRTRTMFVRTVAPEAAPDEAETVEIDFERGDPVAVDGHGLSPAALLATPLNKAARRNARDRARRPGREPLSSG